MPSKKVWTVINISMVLIALLLLLSLFEIKFPTLGQAQYFFDSEEARCMVNWKDNFNLLPDLERCCLESRQQIECVKSLKMVDGKELNWVCSAGMNLNTLKYWLNNKAYNYCNHQMF